MDEIDIFLKRYRHCGTIYPAVPKGWQDIVVQAVIDMEKHMWVGWLPRFVKCWIYDLSKKYEFFKKLKDRLTNDGHHISQIKEKFAGLRIYGYYNEACQKIVSVAETLCDRTCQKCSSMNNPKKTNGSWVKNLCKSCMEEEGVGEHIYMNLSERERIELWKNGEL